MKDVLDYTEEELRNLTVEELETLLVIAEDKESLYNTRQLVEKTLMNSLYGALANKWFPLFNERMAQAITGNGRFFIQLLANNIENKLQSLIPWEEKYIIYGDTDSCIGSTLIKTSKGEMSIADLYENISGDIEKRSDNNFIKHVNEDIQSASVSKDFNIQYNNINYIMKHKVKKRLFKIKCDGDEITITEDHSLMVNRNGTLTEIKPTQIQKGDKILKIK